MSNAFPFASHTTPLRPTPLRTTPLPITAARYGVLALLMLGLPLSAGATTLTWTGAVDANWGTTGNWSGGTGTEIPDSPDDILMFGPGASNLTSTNDITSLQVDQIQLTDGGYSFSGNDVDLVTGLTDTAATGTNTISLTLAGTGGVSKTGTGELILDAANTYTGTTVTSNGILAVTNADSLGATSSGTTVQTSSGRLELRGGSPWPPSRSATRPPA
jgi:autotransporter-associated beta strand protein